MSGYVVVAGYVTVETAVGTGRAHVDVPAGADLPGDVPAEQVQALLARGAIVAVPDADVPAESTPAPRKRAPKAAK